MTFVCIKCNQSFIDGAKLRRHINKKIQCVVDIDPDKICCEHCGKQFTVKSSLKRHIEKRCAILKFKQSEPAAEIDIRELRDLVIDLQKQIKVSTINTSITKHKSRDVNSAINSAVNSTINNGTVINTTNILIRPWAPPDVLHLSLEMLVKEVNQQFMLDCSHLSEEKRANEKIAASHIVRALSTLVMRTHEDPSDRNICTDAARVDQTRVFNEDWSRKVYSFDAIRIIFDNITRDLAFLLSTGQIDHFTTNMKKTLKWMITKYHQNRDEYTRLSKIHLYPHFDNNIPPKDQIAGNRQITNCDAAADSTHRLNIHPWKHLEAVHFSTGFIRTKFRTCDDLNDYNSIYTFTVINMELALKMIKKIIPAVIKILHSIETNRNIRINQTCEIFVYKEDCCWAQISQEEVIDELSDSVIANFRRVISSDEMSIIDDYICRFIKDVVRIYDEHRSTIIKSIAGILIDHLDEVNRG